MHVLFSAAETCWKSGDPPTPVHAWRNIFDPAHESMYVLLSQYVLSSKYIKKTRNKKKRIQNFYFTSRPENYININLPTWRILHKNYLVSWFWILLKLFCFYLKEIGLQGLQQFTTF